MTPDDLTPHSRAEVRHARHTRRRRRIEVAAGLVVVALVAGAGGALWATERGPFASTTETTVPRASDGRPTVERLPKRPDAPACGRALNPGKPLRLWIAGDSLAGSLGPSLGQQTADTGVVAPVYDSRVSSGLANPGFYDWPKRANAELTRLDPEAVAFIIGTNDYVIVNGNEAEGAAWVADYTARTEAMMKLLVGPDQRTVYWISPPIMRTSKMQNAVRQIGDLQRSVAREFPTVTFIDAYSLFDDGDGNYTATTRDPDTGKTITLRAGDGVHLSPDGADLLASAVYQQMDIDWCLTQQTVADATQPVIETKGSTYIPGTRRTTSGSSGTSGTGSGTSGTSGTSGSTGSTGTTGTSGTSTTTAPSATTSTTTAPTTTTTAVPATTSTSRGKP
jgi:hypothetical protein